MPIPVWYHWKQHSVIHPCTATISKSEQSNNKVTTKTNQQPQSAVIMSQSCIQTKQALSYTYKNQRRDVSCLTKKKKQKEKNSYLFQSVIYSRFSSAHPVPGLSFEDSLAHLSQITLKAVLSQIGLELGNLPLQCRDPQCERLRFRQSGGVSKRTKSAWLSSPAIATKSAPQA